ncbi:hypothetical protein SDRG_08143 [Saprolegnia diclina VS20]|uniref:Aquaporin n=1 Tax=Saprolegnia diclina (strain VS20) TaxID=1156394 RepID=T0RVC0_SAPDV|nr:hypothetical protein SDRG_08143 [Saprolegnia diclina VS20]EQC34372.1 hypothetical protein SDRG_08143 [Saprolegnia diclina VS20]|eukprot:XP_008612234.1 hypothetical protein SDRG_08143 [Saprolegnia diclina VS20]
MGLPKALSWLDAPRSFAQLDGDSPIVISTLRRECLAEAFATFVLVGFGAGSVIQSTISAGALGNYTHVTLTWGIAVMLGINVAGGRSRGHLNPAFTIVYCLYHSTEMSWRAAICYCGSQLVGAFLGFAAVYSMYYRALQAYDPHQSLETSGHLFASYPAATETLASAFFGEVVCSAFFMAGAFALGDASNPYRSTPLLPVLTGTLVVGVGMAFGLTTGYAVNPAVDFGGRLFSSLAGWGIDVFCACDNYWWVPILAPLVGGWLGAGSYLFCSGSPSPAVLPDPTS